MYLEQKLIDKITVTDSDFTSLIFDTLPIAKSLYSNPDARFYLRTTSEVGTATLDLNIRGVVSNGGDGEPPVAFDIGAFDQVTANGKSTKEIANCPRFVEIFADIGGSSSPAFTIEVWVTR